MPLKLNAGLSRKVADGHYGSRGASVNVELELDSGIIAEPVKLQDRIRQLFTIVRTSLAEELNGNGSGHTPSNGKDNGQTKSAPPANGNGNGSSGNGGARRSTQSQCKAILAIARNRRIDVAQFLNERFHVSRPDDLTIKDASVAIDQLKGDEGRTA